MELVSTLIHIVNLPGLINAATCHVLEPVLGSPEGVSQGIHYLRFRPTVALRKSRMSGVEENVVATDTLI